MDTAQRDAGCDCSEGVAADLPDTVPAPGPKPPQAMTACRAAPLIQKVIA